MRSVYKTDNFFLNKAAKVLVQWLTWYGRTHVSGHVMQDSAGIIVRNTFTQSQWFGVQTDAFLRHVLYLSEASQPFFDSLLTHFQMIMMSHALCNSFATHMLRGLKLATDEDCQCLVHFDDALFQAP